MLPVQAVPDSIRWSHGSGQEQKGYFLLDFLDVFFDDFLVVFLEAFFAMALGHLLSHARI